MGAARRGFAAIAIFLIPGGVVAAAGLASPDVNPYMEPDATPTWDGFYAGAQAGADIESSGKTAGLGGLRAGYNWQVDKIVLGVEGQSNWRPGNNGSSSIDWVGAPSGTHYATTVGGAANFVSTLTGRVGYSVGDRLLPFLSAGLAFSDLGMKTTLVGLTGPFAGSYGQNSSDTLRFGWTIGAGLEYRLSRHWSVEGQYQYFSFRTNTMVTYGYLHGAQVSNFTFRDNGTGRSATFGVNYRF